MKLFIFLIFFISNLLAITKSEVYKSYKQQRYTKTCEEGTWIFNKNKNDDLFNSILSISCVNADMINNAIRISKFMNKSKLSRHNASYIATLYLIKKLLLQLVYDKIDISNLSLPKSSHPLSIVFENIAQHNYKIQNEKYIVYDNGNKYILSKTKNHKFSIEIYQNKNLISKRIYW